MHYSVFCNNVKENVQTNLGIEYNVNIIKVDKLNGLILQSMVIHKDQETISPNIYMEQYYEKYQSGESIESLAALIIFDYFRADKQSKISVPNLTEFDSVKDKLFFKLINFNKNQELLKSIPHIKWLDLAIIFSILLKKDSDGIGSCHVKNELISSWEVDLDCIFEHAKENTPILFGSSVRSMDEIIRGMISQDFIKGEVPSNVDDMFDLLLPRDNNIENPNKMYVASNTVGINGASWLLYKNELHTFSSFLQMDLYILPSSIHEIILIPSNKGISNHELLNMVKEVNCSQVPVNEVLSDNVYFYEREQDKIHALF